MAIEIGTLVVEMSANVARLSQDMDKVRGTVDRAMDGVKRSAELATTALGLIGVGVSVAGLGNIVKGAIDVMAALDDMAAKTGSSVENLSALAEVAKIGGHEIGLVESGMVRLTKALAGGDDEAKAAGHALEMLGLKAEDLRRMDTGQAMLEVAKALDRFADSGGKTALVMDLLGKNGAALLPFLQDLAEKGELHARVTKQEAAEAEKLQKQINELKIAHDDLGNSLARITVPALLKVIENFKQAREAGYGFWQAVTGIGVRGLNESIGDARNNAGSRIKELGEERAKLEKDRAYYADRGDQMMARDVGVDIAKLDKRIAYYKALQRDSVAAQYAGDEYLDARDLALRQKGSLSGYTSPEKDKPEKKPAAGGAVADPDAWFSGDMRKALDAETKATQKAQDEIERLRQKYVQMADPLQKYRDQLDEINKLRADGVLTADQALAAEWTVNESLDAAIGKMDELGNKTKETSSFAKDFGLTFSSAAEDAIVSGKKLGDVVRGVGDDIARMIVRKKITEPLGKAASSFLDTLDFGKLFGFANGGSFTVGGSGSTDSQLVAFRATPGESVDVRTPGQQSGGQSITVVQHISIDSRSDQATIMQAMVAAKDQAKAEIMASMRRGGSFA
jgi:hypothetical protein